MQDDGFSFFHGFVDMLQKPVREYGADCRRQHDPSAAFPVIVLPSARECIHEETDSHDDKIYPEQLHEDGGVKIRGKQENKTERAVDSSQKQQTRDPAQIAVFHIKNQLDAGDNGTAEEIGAEHYPDKPFREFLPSGENDHKCQRQQAKQEIRQIFFEDILHKLVDGIEKADKQRQVQDQIIDIFRKQNQNASQD